MLFCLAYNREYGSTVTIIMCFIVLSIQRCDRNKIIFYSILIPTFMSGSMYDDIRLHVARSYTSSADSPFSLISLYFVQPSSLRSSSLSSPLHLHFHRPPSYVLFLSSHHIPIPLQASFLDFLFDFAHFRCPSYAFISYLVRLRTSAHPS